jgi:hypothetical protein
MGGSGLWITSLNSHFSRIGSGTRCCGWSSRYGGKENPHQPVAKPMGDCLIQRVNPMFTLLDLYCKADAKEKKTPTTTSQWGVTKGGGENKS